MSARRWIEEERHMRAAAAVPVLGQRNVALVSWHEARPERSRETGVERRLPIEVSTTT